MQNKLQIVILIEGHAIIFYYEIVQSTKFTVIVVLRLPGKRQRRKFSTMDLIYFTLKEIFALASEIGRYVVCTEKTCDRLLYVDRQHRYEIYSVEKTQCQP